MAKSVEDSLRRLKTDRIDIYLPHLDDGITPIEEVVRGLDDLVRAGKVLYAGLSNFPAWRVGIAATLANLRGWAPIAALQLEYSLIERTAEREFLPMATALGLGVMGYSPLAVGVLTDKYRRGEAGRKGTALELEARSNAILDALLSVSGQIGCSPGAAAIAWSIRKQVVPILGPRTHTQLLDNLAALQVELSDDDLRRLDDASGFTLGQPYDVLAAGRKRLGLIDVRTGHVA
jgi:aryl-alcohol dehydrogenase-like predicted oxidoreductase